MYESFTLSADVVRGGAAQFAGWLQAWREYRRDDLGQVSNAVDCHLRELLAEGRLKKLAQR